MRLKKSKHLLKLTSKMAKEVVEMACDNENYGKSLYSATSVKGKVVNMPGESKYNSSKTYSAVAFTVTSL